ncbi:MAG: type II toxin-antitoxin system PemK/MazF family toxin [Acidobacteriota bacterium]|nr:type II toxin-antitoxin system PemK/MazF family toxin [Acidobacteriota bacterium]
MRRGDLYRVARPGGADPKAFRVFAVVGRQAVIDSRFSTVVCAPVYSARHGLSSQVAVGPDEGLKHDSALHCDELVSLPKARLAAFVGRLSAAKLRALDQALVAALDIDLDALIA